MIFDYKFTKLKLIIEILFTIITQTYFNMCFTIPLANYGVLPDFLCFVFGGVYLREYETGGPSLRCCNAFLTSSSLLFFSSRLLEVLNVRV